jgi:hypothetical protein
MGRCKIAAWLKPSGKSAAARRSRAAVAVRGLAQGNNASFAWAQVLDNALYHSIRAGCIPALEDDQYLLIALNEVPLQFDQLHLKLAQTFFVGPF